MSVLVVGSVALDSVETPFGKADDVLGGSANFFAASASHLTKVSVVGVVGSDYPIEKLEPLKKRGVDFSGLEKADGDSFRWRGRYRHDLNSAETLETHLGVFSRFSPKIPEKLRHARICFSETLTPASSSMFKPGKEAEADRVHTRTSGFKRPELLELLAA